MLARCLLVAALAAVAAAGSSGTCQVSCTTFSSVARASYQTACTSGGGTFTYTTTSGSCTVATDCSSSEASSCQTIASQMNLLGSVGCTGALVACSSDSKCFPASATVLLADGTPKTMADVQVGDVVQVGAGEVSPVFMFSHRVAASETRSLFVAITTADNNTLQLTADHYLYVNGALATAQTVRVGDKLTSAKEETVAVASVERVWGEGLYNPHTMHGDLIVDGIKTSCYTAAINPTLAHAALWPVRALYSSGVDIVKGAFDKGSDFLPAVLPRGQQSYAEAPQAAPAEAPVHTEGKAMSMIARRMGLQPVAEEAATGFGKVLSHVRRAAQP